MKNFDLARAIGTFANVGVVTGIVFLAIEIRQNSAQIEQNTVAAAAQAVFQLNQEANTRHQALAQDETLAELVYRGYENPALPSEAEGRRFAHFLRAVFNVHEAAWLYQRKGLIGDADFAGWRVSVCDILAFRGAREFWDSGDGSYAEGFAEDVAGWCGE